MIADESDDGRRLLSFHGPVKIYQRVAEGGLREYVVTPLTDAAVLDALGAVRERRAWYEGVGAALRAVEQLSVTVHPMALGQVRAALVALRHPTDSDSE